jgi:hypothetical protein
MDSERFDRLALALTRPSTRRTIMAFLCGLGLTGLLTRDAAACDANTVRCASNADCCSGRCVRKRGTDRKFCRPAVSQGVCTIDSNYCASEAGTSSCGSPDCNCYRRQNGASVCATVSNCAFSGNCTNAKCRALLGNEKAFCAMSQIDGCCNGVTGACVLPCPGPFPL